MILFAAAIFLFAIGIWKLTQFDLKPHELFFGVLLVCILAFVAVALGFLAKPVSAFSEKTLSAPAKSKKRWAWLRSLVVALVIALLLRTFVLGIFYATSDAVSPEVPRGSRVFVFKLNRSFKPGDIIVYERDGKDMLARVTGEKRATGSPDLILIERRGESPEAIQVADVIGKVIFNTRGSGSDGASNLSYDIPATERQLEKEIDRRLRQAGFDAKAVFVTVSPKLDRAECRLQDVRQGGMGFEPFGGGIRIKRVNNQSFWKSKKDSAELLWSIEGFNVLSQVRFTTATSPEPLAIANEAFGPVMERTVNDIDEKMGKECLALESGKLFDFNEAEIKALPKAEQQKWFDDRGVNLLTDTVGGNRGVGLRNLSATLVANEAWDWNRDVLIKAFRPDEPGVEYKDRSGFRWHQIPTNAPLPMTFVIRTSSGRPGVLQILAFTDDPGGVKSRYKIQNSAKSDQNVWRERVRFGPVIERTLADPDNGSGKGNRETLNLRTGEQFSALDEAPREGGGRLRALVASEGDLYAEYDDFVSKSWALDTAGMRFADFPARQWDSATAQDVVEALRESTVLQKMEHSGATLYLLPENFVPLTLAFETRDGTRGLLQITQFEDNPRSLKIRYKLAQYVGAAAKELTPIPSRAAELLAEKMALTRTIWIASHGV